jgi:predicted outer membrane repeat protein
VDGQDLYRVLDIAGATTTLSELTVQRGNAPGASEDGAGIRSNRALTLTNVNVLSSTAGGDGGGVYVNGNLTAIGGLFQNNRSTGGSAGALYSFGEANLTGVQFVSNTAQSNGGAIAALVAVTTTNVLFQDNQCLAPTCDGGALYSFSQATLLDTQFVNNTAQDRGGGASAPGTLRVENGLFQGNRSVSNLGGGLYAQFTAEISGTRFLSNTARGFGGGLYGLAAVTVTNGLFQGNQSTLNEGGGLAATGPLVLSNTHFVGNRAAQGGAIFHNVGAGRIVNGLFAGNVASSTLGAAMLLNSPGLVEVIHTTIVGPPAGGAAIQVLTGTLSITNTILVSHTVGISVTGGTVTQDYNLFFGNGADTLGVVSGGANSVAGDPSFVDPSSDNYHLGPGSAAIDTGTDAGVTTDSDGEVRPQGAGFDIGLDEFTPQRIFLPLVTR